MKRLQAKKKFRLQKEDKQKITLLNISLLFIEPTDLQRYEYFSIFIFGHKKNCVFVIIIVF